MKSSQSSGERIERNALLSELRGKATFGKFSTTHESRKKSSFVYIWLHDDEKGPFNRKRLKLHLLAKANLRNRSDEPTAPLPYGCQISSDFVCNIPWENEHIIRLCLKKALDGVNGDVTTR